MPENPLLLIYRTRRSDLSPEEMAALQQIEAAACLVEEPHVPAVVGQLAGTAIHILTSAPVTALANLIQIGTPLWLLIDAAIGRKRTVFVDKPGAAALAAATFAENIGQDPPRTSAEPDFAAAKVWGPMEAEPLVGFQPDWFVRDGASLPRAYFMAIAVPWHRERVRTYWYVISDGGELCSAWWTQTLRERVPEFLRPERPN